MQRGACIVRSFAFGAVLVAVLSACNRTKRQYETTVEVTRIAAVRQDDDGNPLTLDLEVSYSECPGAQMEVIRGGADFAACVAKYKVGETINVGIDQEWAPAGHYKWTVRKVGDCTRVPDPADEGAYAIIRECDHASVNGARVGFQCKHIPEKSLVEKCPWFRRR